MSIVDVEIVQVFLSENIPSFRLYLKERERERRQDGLYDVEESNESSD